MLPSDVVVGAMGMLFVLFIASRCSSSNRSTEYRVDVLVSTRSTPPLSVSRTVVLDTGRWISTSSGLREASVAFSWSSSSELDLEVGGWVFALAASPAFSVSDPSVGSCEHD